MPTLKIQFRQQVQCTQVAINQAGYERSFVRAEEPFELHTNPEWAAFEQRFIPTHDYLELIEVEDDAPVSATQSATKAASTEVEPTAENPPAANTAPLAKKK